MNIMKYELDIMDMKFQRLHDEVCCNLRLLMCNSLSIDLEARSFQIPSINPIRTGVIKSFGFLLFH